MGRICKTRHVMLLCCYVVMGLTSKTALHKAQNYEYLADKLRITTQEMKHQII